MLEINKKIMKNAEEKAFDIITSCKEPIHFEVALSYLRQYVLLFGPTDEWKALIDYLDDSWKKFK